MSRHGWSVMATVASLCLLVAGLVGATAASAQTAPSLTITKAASSSQVATNTAFTYTITVKNTGNAAATGVLVTDALPTSLTGVSASFDVDPGSAGGTGACTVGAGNTAFCSVGTLAANDNATNGPDEVVVTINATTPNTCGELSNTAHVTWDGNTTGVISNTATVTVTGCGPTLTITKAASSSQVATNTPFTYTITVKNTGNTQATGVVVTDDLPDSLTGVSANFDVDPGSAGGTGACTVGAGNTVSCSVGTLAANDNATNGPDEVVVIINATTPNTCVVLTNTATVDADQTSPQTSNGATVDVTGCAPSGSLELAKHLSGGPAGYTGPFTIHWDCGTFGSGDEIVSAGSSATVSGIPTGSQCTVSETPPFPPVGYSFGMPTFSPSDTVSITTKDATVTVTTNNTLTRDTGSLHITKLVVGGGAGFTGSLDFHVVCTGDGGTYDRTIAYPTPGDVTISSIPTGNTCTVTETSQSSPPTGYTWGAVTITGSPTAVISTVTTREVTVTNTVTGRAKVIKTKGELPLSGTDSFTFQLRQGADTSNVGTILDSQNATAANGGVIDFATVLVPGQHYQACELVMPGWNTSLQGTLFVPGSIIPPALPNPNVDNSPVCVDFVAQAGVTTTFNVDNTFPGGLARTIGFWKNWASCAKSNGGQKPVLDQTLALAQPTGIVVSAQSGTYPGFAPTLYLVLHGSTSTPNVASDCGKTVNLLNKSTMTSGKKMSSDPAFNLVAQLIGAELNFTAGAAKNGAVITAVNQGVVLLGKYTFTGDGYTGKISATDAATMNNLANTLDNYNNNRP